MNNEPALATTPSEIVRLLPNYDFLPPSVGEPGAVLFTYLGHALARAYRPNIFFFNSLPSVRRHTWVGTHRNPAPFRDINPSTR